MQRINSLSNTYPLYSVWFLLLLLLLLIFVSCCLISNLILHCDFIENYSTQIPRDDGTSILLHLWDTAGTLASSSFFFFLAVLLLSIYLYLGQEDYDRLRPLR